MIAAVEAPVSKHTTAPARIGPNAITRVADALRSEAGDARARQVFAVAGLVHYLHAPPTAMVDETEVIALQRALRAEMGEPVARRIARAAGTATGDYLLAHRIPHPVQRLLRALPASLAARVLLRAIRRHAWTFAGSGVFEARAGHPLRLSIRGSPMCRGAVSPAPVCDYYAATFERLFRALVHRRADVVETGCEACGAVQCEFEIRW